MNKVVRIGRGRKVTLCANDSETSTPLGITVEDEGGEVTGPWRRST